jgi:hypothetical protein
MAEAARRGSAVVRVRDMTLYKFLVGLVLTIAMIAVLSLSALVFSARDFQFGVAQFSNTSGLVDFKQLEQINSLIEQSRSESAAARGENQQITNRLTDLQAKVDQAQDAATQARAQVVHQIADLEQRVNVQPSTALVQDTSAQALAQRLNAVAARQLSPGDQQTVALLRGRVQDVAEKESSHDDSSAERTALMTRQQLVSGQVTESDQNILGLEQRVLPSSPDQFNRIYGEAQALQKLSPLGVSAYMAQGSPSILSTLLVLLMGALGSLLYLFPAYLNRPQPVTMAEIAVRLIFGMCAALAFYVLANATISGVAIASNATQASTASTLNPFTVSLIGIVAGVLSEDIAKWIQDRGRGIFTQGGASVTPAVPAPAASTSDDVTFSGVNPHGGPDTP